MLMNKKKRSVICLIKSQSLLYFLFGNCCPMRNHSSVMKYINVNGSFSCIHRGSDRTRRYSASTSSSYQLSDTGNSHSSNSVFFHSRNQILPPVGRLFDAAPEKIGFSNSEKWCALISRYLAVLGMPGWWRHIRRTIPRSAGSFERLQWSLAGAPACDVSRRLPAKKAPIAGKRLNFSEFFRFREGGIGVTERGRVPSIQGHRFRAFQALQTRPTR